MPRWLTYPCVGVLMWCLASDPAHISALRASRCDCAVDDRCSSEVDVFTTPVLFRALRHMRISINQNSDLCAHVPGAISVTSQCHDNTIGQNIRVTWRMEVTERLEGFKVSLNDYDLGPEVKTWFVTTAGLQTSGMVTFHICLHGVTPSKKNIAILRQPPLMHCDNSIAVDFIPGDLCRTSTQGPPRTIQGSSRPTITPGDSALPASSLRTGYRMSGPPAPPGIPRAEGSGRTNHTGVLHESADVMETARDWGAGALTAGIVGIVLVILVAAVTFLVRKHWKSSPTGSSQDDVAEPYDSKVSSDTDSLSPSDSASQASIQVLSTVADIHGNNLTHSHRTHIPVQPASVSQHGLIYSRSGQAYCPAEVPHWNQWLHLQHYRHSTQLDYMSVPVTRERPLAVPYDGFRSAPAHGSWKPPVVNIDYSDIDEMVAEINQDNA